MAKRQKYGHNISRYERGVEPAGKGGGQVSGFSGGDIDKLSQPVGAGVTKALLKKFKEKKLVQAENESTIFAANAHSEWEMGMVRYNEESLNQGYEGHAQRILDHMEETGSAALKLAPNDKARQKLDLKIKNSTAYKFAVAFQSEATGKVQAQKMAYAKIRTTRMATQLLPGINTSTNMLKQLEENKVTFNDLEGPPRVRMQHLNATNHEDVGIAIADVVGNEDVAAAEEYLDHLEAGRYNPFFHDELGKLEDHKKALRGVVEKGHVRSQSAFINAKDNWIHHITNNPDAMPSHGYRGAATQNLKALLLDSYGGNPNDPKYIAAAKDLDTTIRLHHKFRTKLDVISNLSHTDALAMLADLGESNILDAGLNKAQRAEEDKLHKMLKTYVDNKAKVAGILNMKDQNLHMFMAQYQGPLLNSLMKASMDRDRLAGVISQTKNPEDLRILEGQRAQANSDIDEIRGKILNGQLEYGIPNPMAFSPKEYTDAYTQLNTAVIQPHPIAAVANVLTGLTQKWGPQYGPQLMAYVASHSPEGTPAKLLRVLPYAAQLSNSGKAPSQSVGKAIMNPITEKIFNDMTDADGTKYNQLRGQFNSHDKVKAFRKASGGWDPAKERALETAWNTFIRDYVDAGMPTDGMNTRLDKAIEDTLGYLFYESTDGGETVYFPKTNYDQDMNPAPGAHRLKERDRGGTEYTQRDMSAIARQMPDKYLNHEKSLEYGNNFITDPRNFGAGEILDFSKLKETTHLVMFNNIPYYERNTLNETMASMKVRLNPEAQGYEFYYEFEDADGNIKQANVEYKDGTKPFVSYREAAVYQYIRDTEETQRKLDRNLRQARGYDPSQADLTGTGPERPGLDVLGDVAAFSKGSLQIMNAFYKGIGEFPGKVGKFGKDLIGMVGKALNRKLEDMGKYQIIKDVKAEEYVEEGPLKLREWTGKYTDEGRKIFFNNKRGVSSELTIGVKHPEINDGKETHIPSIYGGKIVDQATAEQIIIDNDGKDPETGRHIPPGGNPEDRSKSIISEDMDAYTKELMHWEGFVAEAKIATKGEKFKTIGHGHLDEKGEYKDKIITRPEALELLKEDITERLPAIRKAIPKFESLPLSVRTAILVGWFRGDIQLTSKGKTSETVKLMNKGEWKKAAIEYLNHKGFKNAKANKRSGIIARMKKVAKVLREYGESLQEGD